MALVPPPNPLFSVKGGGGGLVIGLFEKRTWAFREGGGHGCIEVNEVFQIMCVE